MTCLAKFNLMRSLLKGEALQHFNKKAEELENENNAHHAECISAVSGHIFSKEHSADAKCYLQKVHLHNPMTISKYFTHWHQQNDYFSLFPPHGRMAQKISDDKIIKLIYIQICMKSDLEHAKKCQEWKAKKASSHNEIHQNGG